MNQNIAKRLAIQSRIHFDTFGSPVVDNAHQLSVFAQNVVLACAEFIGDQEVTQKLMDHFEIKPVVNPVPHFIP